MTRVLLLLLLLISTFTGAPSQKVCSYQDVVDYLNLTTDASAYRVTRPVLDHTHLTVVELDIILYSILDVIEKTQTFISFIWTSMTWNDERISWDPAQFCGITNISIPKDMIWRPDIFIYEMTQKDNSPPSPYMSVSHDGTVLSDEGLLVVSTCKMDVHKFPFDTQRCSISVGSALYSVAELRVVPSSNSSRTMQYSQEVMKSQAEWEFLNLSISTVNFNLDGRQWDQLVYTFVMKRRPLLHVTNFLLPILFFLSLDLASFFIADHRGEKLGFKVTVLLAISVLLLILKDILPAVSNKSPLIATYCIVIFALMLLSLLETILVMNLMEKDAASQQELMLRDKRGKGETGNCDAEEKRQTFCSCICNASNGDGRPHLLPATQEVNNSIKSEESHVFLLILEELKELQNTLNLHFGGRQEGGKFHRMATKINRAFFIFYVTIVSLFLPLIFIEWVA